MGPQSPRHRHPAPLSRRRRPPTGVRLRCEPLDDRIAPAVFNPQTATSYTGLSNNGCVATADFNKDGFTDAVFTNFGTGYGSPYDTGVPGNSIVILYGRSGGGFNRVQLSTSGDNVSFVSVGDINSDTWPDLVATNANRQNVGSVSVFRNDGAGNLSLFGTPFSTFGQNSACVRLTDVTGDNVLDVIVASFGKNNGSDSVTGQNVTVFQGLADAQGKGNFTFSGSPIATLAPQIQFVPTAVVVADFDGDNAKDIAAVVPGVPADSNQPQPNGSIYIFKGNGSGGFSAPNQVETGGALPVNVQAGDLNGDGKLDLVVANAGDPNSNPEFSNDGIGVLLNVSSTGNIAFGVPSSLTTNAYGTFAVAIADFNLDGRADIASVNYGAQINFSPVSHVSLFLGNTSGGFTPDTPGTYNTTALPGGQYLAVGNFDGNSTPDLIVAHASNLVGMLLNTTTPVTPKPTVSGVQINGGAAQRSQLTSLTVTFNTQVNFAGAVAAAFQIQRIGGTAVGGFTATANVVGGATVVTLNGFTGANTENGSLADGRYTLTVLASQVSTAGGALDGNNDGTSGDNYTLSDSGTAGGLFRFFGDTNGDRVVDGLDFFALRGTFNLNSTQAGYLAYLDFNGDGIVDGLDFFQFRNRFNMPLP